MPVTIITGFLGSGKTTLLNNILKKYSTLKTLIIENEVGEINIDGSLIKKGTNNSIYEITNGCICCSLKTELGTLLNSMILSRTNHDYLLIEATGIADPEEIIHMFNGRRVQRYFKLDGVISVVDANLVLTQLPKYPEVKKQITQSDMVLINKADTVSDDELSVVNETVESLNPFASILQCAYSDISNSEILNRNAYHPKSIEKSITDFSTLSFAPKHSLQSIALEFKENLNLEKISIWLDTFLNDESKDVLRIKGVLNIRDMKHKIILQSVGKQFQVYQGEEWKDTERTNKLVFIGNGFNKRGIINSIKPAIVTSSIK